MDIKQLRSRRSQSVELIQGTPTKERLKTASKNNYGLIIFSVIFAIVFIMILAQNFGGTAPPNPRLIFSNAIFQGLKYSFFALSMYLLLPFLRFLIYFFQHWKLPPKSIFQNFTLPQMGYSIFSIAVFIVYWLNHETAQPWISHLNQIRSPSDFLATDQSLLKQLGIESLLVSFLLLTGVMVFFPKQPLPKKNKSDVTVNLKTPKTSVSLFMGVSSGELLKHNHGASLAPKQNITLPLEDACQNILVLGGIGSGKTTRAIHPLLLQLFDQACGGLIFDIKGDFKHAVTTFAEMAKQSVAVIGPGHNAFNLLSGLTPELAASFLKSACLLNQRQGLDSFWIETATELCRNCLGILSFLPEHYTLQGLYRYLFEAEFRQNINPLLFSKETALDASQKRLLKNYTLYYDTIYTGFDDKVKSGVMATIAQILSPFNHPMLMDTFCTDNDNVSLQSILQGQVFLVDLPLSQWGFGAKVAYTFIKLRFFNLMQQRLTHPEWNQTQPAFFLCDEFQEIVSCNKDGLSDLNFWDKARSSKTIGIVSAQSISSFYAAIGDHDMANALLQNFRQKICFKTEDQTTLDYLNRLTGHVEVAKRSYSEQSGHTNPSGKLSKSSHKSTNESLSYHDKPLLDAQLIRRLGPNEAIALLSVAGRSMDDVISMNPLYLQ